jgi:alpha-tubulin suppressor-like RCC1 family protein
MRRIGLAALAVAFAACSSSGGGTDPTAADPGAEVATDVPAEAATDVLPELHCDPGACEDFDPCTQEGCDPVTGCTHTPMADGAPCPLGTCQAGVCVTKVKSVVAGDEHACAVGADDVMWCWGSGYRAQLGDGKTSDRTVPVEAAIGGKALTAAAGASHTCAVRLDGSAWCWGDNTFGQAGNGTSGTGSETKPVAVSGLESVVGLVSGQFHLCAVVAAEGLACWGGNEGGQVGDGTYSDRNKPVFPAGFGTIWYDGVVGTGGLHTCAMMAGGSLSCWGANDQGQLGDGTTSSKNLPTAVGSLKASMVAGGLGHTCAVAEGQALKCWGANDKGQLGNGTTSTMPATAPAAVPGMDGGVELVAAGASHTCAVRSGTLWCWGYNASGQLGDGTTEDRPSPVQVMDLPGKVVGAAAGMGFTCAITDDDRLWCWGENQHGQLGDGTTSSRGTPGLVL